MAVRRSSSFAYPSRSLPFTLSPLSAPASSPKGPGQSPPFFDSRELSRRPAASAMESNRFLLVATAAAAAAAAAFQSADEPMHRRVERKRARERERERGDEEERTGECIRPNSASFGCSQLDSARESRNSPRCPAFRCFPLHPFESLYLPCAVLALQIAITETSDDNRIERRDVILS